MSQKTLVILVPLYKAEISQYEELSLKRLITVFGRRYDVRFLAPPDLDISRYSNIILDSLKYSVEYFKKSNFKSAATYNRLFVNRRLYERFSNWKFILIYHLDAFIFHDNLLEWCAQGYDNIGAPLYNQDGTDHPTEFIGVGNGGFCLRKVSSCIKVLSSSKILYPWSAITKDLKSYSIKGKFTRLLYYLDMVTTLGSRSNFIFNRIRVNEDVFWGILVPQKFKWFKVPDETVASKFSIEFNIVKLFRKNALPTGCHGWYKPNLFKYWRPLLEDQFSNPLTPLKKDNEKNIFELIP